MAETKLNFTRIALGVLALALFITFTVLFAAVAWRRPYFREMFSPSNGYVVQVTLSSNGVHGTPPSATDAWNAVQRELSGVQFVTAKQGDNGPGDSAIKTFTITKFPDIRILYNGVTMNPPYVAQNWSSNGIKNWVISIVPGVTST